MATTRTHTKTYARTELLSKNIRAALRATGWPSSLVTPLVDIGLASENRFISEFHTYGMVPNTDRWRFRSWISIDWDEHGRLLTSKANVAVDERWVDGEHPGLIELSDGFGALIRDYDLTPKYAWVYSDHIDNDPAKKQAAREMMGLNSVRLEVKPDGAVEDSESNRITGLEEVTYGSESAFSD
ncbi:hypothetical protein [Tsukamurella tyrosinosolvens]|uniref:hypothetical protein n=1 Tax=Tsukamurella tyrosinosolvens TaxID=57704 RepID=UPI0011C05D40|nr:hypothetical protein [Tsukamurella tyrosinosolvens]